MKRKSYSPLRRWKFIARKELQFFFNKELTGGCDVGDDTKRCLRRLNDYFMGQREATEDYCRLAARKVWFDDGDVEEFLAKCFKHLDTICHRQKTRGLRAREKQKHPAR
jgi:hypothetical protein